MSTRFLAALTSLVAFVGLFAATAHAEPCPTTLAKDTLSQGTDLWNQGQVEQACEKFRAAYACNGEFTEALYMLGQCEEKLGHVGSALSNFSELQRKELLAGRAPRAKIAEDLASAVEPRVPHLLIKASEQVKAMPGLKVTLNNDPVLPATFGVDRRPNPGSYELVVTADQREPWKTTVTLAEKESKVVELQVGGPQLLQPPQVTLMPPPNAGATPGLRITIDKQPVPLTEVGKARQLGPGEHVVEVNADGRKPWTARISVTPGQAQTLNLQIGAPDDLPPPPEDDPGAAQRTLGLIAGGLGIIGIGVGSFEGLSAIGKNDDSKDHCNAQNLCDDTGLTQRSDAIDAANLSTIGFVAGGALLAGGAVLYFTAPSKDDPPATTGLWIGPSSVALRGAF